MGEYLGNDLRAGREGSGPAHLAADVTAPGAAHEQQETGAGSCPHSSILPWPFAFLPVVSPLF